MTGWGCAFDLEMQCRFVSGVARWTRRRLGLPNTGDVGEVVRGQINVAKGY